MKIVILHGWGHSASLWQSLAEKFENAIAIDMPGFGNEPLVSQNWGVPEYANWVEEKIGKENTILIGHSFGGRVAAEIASKNPKWLKAVVLSGSPCLYMPTLSTKLKIIIYKFLKNFLPFSLRQTFYSNDLIDARNMGLEKIFRKVVSFDQTAKLKKINCATLLIWGEDDRDVPLRIARKMHTLIKQSELKIIEDAGHNSYFDNPNLFYGYVKKFIENI